MFKSIIFTLNTYIYQIPTYTCYFDDIVVPNNDNLFNFPVGRLS